MSDDIKDELIERLEAHVDELEAALKGAAIIADAAGAEIRALKARLAELEARVTENETAFVVGPRYDFTVTGMKRSETGNWMMVGRKS